jgi:hypothetical protein
VISKVIEAWEAHKEFARAQFAAGHPGSYKALVGVVVKMLAAAWHAEYSHPDPDRIHEIDDGDYQGTLVFVVAATGYQPSRYWYVKVGYGSCSGCDTLQSICDYSSGPPTTEQIDQYMTLALHVVQRFKEMQDEETT